MLNNKIRILNFDDSIVKQNNLISGYKTETVNFKDIAPKARFWIDNKMRNLIRERLEDSCGSSVTFIGSGDYHHISEILISRFIEPINVIVFDFHPDWSIFSPRYACGSWVNRILEKANVLNLILLGVSSPDISSFVDIQSGNLSSFKDNRVQLYPYEHAPTRTFLKRIPENSSIVVDDGIFFHKIYWDELKNKNLEEFFIGFLNRLPRRKTYISIDKDCLTLDYALTNWEGGKVPLDELLVMLKLIRENLDIIGLDITGDYSPVLAKGLFRNLVAHFDHPRRIKAACLTEPEITSLNEETNLKILQALIS